MNGCGGIVGANSDSILIKNCLTGINDYKTISNNNDNFAFITGRNTQNTEVQYTMFLGEILKEPKYPTGVTSDNIKNNFLYSTSSNVSDSKRNIFADSRNIKEEASAWAMVEDIPHLVHFFKCPWLDRNSPFMDYLDG